MRGLQPPGVRRGTSTMREAYTQSPKSPGCKTANPTTMRRKKR